MVRESSYIANETVDGRVLPGPPNSPPSTDAPAAEVIPGDPDYVVPVEEEEAP